VAGHLFHYTDADSFKAISSQPTWVFKASQPPGEHPEGAYFTTLGPNTKNLSRRLGIPTEKLSHVFCFRDAGDLRPLRGKRGKFVVYSRTNYAVTKKRQVYYGDLEKARERFS
jgi:hypothetical protein